MEIELNFHIDDHLSDAPEIGEIQTYININNNFRIKYENQK